MEPVLSLAIFLSGVLVSYILMRVFESRLKDHFKVKYNLHTSDEVRVALEKAETQQEAIQKYAGGAYLLPYKERVVGVLNNLEWIL